MKKRAAVQKKVIVSAYHSLLGQVKTRIRDAQYNALKAVNRELIRLYWDIGKMIVDRQGKQAWGKSVVEHLACDLQREFPGIKGFSTANLWRMKNFYETYRRSEKLAPVVREIGWSHNVIIFEKCKDLLQREFYIRMTRKFGWSKNVLALQIENQSYQKTLLNQTNFDKTVPKEIRKQAKLAVKDEYLFDFLELKDRHDEKQMEEAILSRMQEFLQELGNKFAFLGSQYKLEVEGKEFFIDMVLYHRVLRCLVAIELKIGEFKPEYVGKMQFYLSAMDSQVKLKDENPSIGIILCRHKNRVFVEYALRDSNRPIGVSTYRLLKKLPRSLSAQLPAPKDIKRMILAIDSQ